MSSKIVKRLFYKKCVVYHNEISSLFADNSMQSSPTSSKHRGFVVFAMFPVLWLLLLLLYSNASNVLQSLQNNNEWWMLDNTTNANMYYRIEGKLVFLRHVVMDSRNIHSCYEYKVYDIETQLIEKSRTFCYPAVFISGYKKCSTSALYMLMTQYSEVLRDHGKENCIFGNEGGRNVLGLFDTYPSSIRDGVLLVSGCIYWDRNYLMNEVLRHPNSFYIVGLVYRTISSYYYLLSDDLP